MGQFNFVALAPFDLEKRLPTTGLLSVFAYLRDGEGQLTIPHEDRRQLRGFYFEDISQLAPCEEDELLIPNSKEIPLEFFAYADVPEFGGKGCPV